jgi:thiamine-phosphate pyrophosphorylase
MLYYITDRTQFPGTDVERRRALLSRIAEAANAGVDLVQLREKDLAAGALESLARQALEIVRRESSHTRLLINSRLDVALAVCADGVHLTSNDINAAEARSVIARAGNAPKREFLISAACHSAHDVRLAEGHGADFAVLAPIFGKQIPNSPALPGIGVWALREATQVDQAPDLRVEAGDRRSSLPVLALGGVNAENARDCMLAGAAGIAGIRIFQEGNLADTVAKLRQL